MVDSKVYYKLIFDAIFEKKSLKELVGELGRAIDANVNIILNSGESMADTDDVSSRYWDKDGLPDFEQMRILEQDKVINLDGHIECIMEPILKDGKKVGNILFDYEVKDEQPDYRSIAVTLAEAVAGMIPKSANYYHRGWSLTKSVINKHLFDEMLRDHISIIQRYFAPPYVAVMVERGENEAEIKNFLLSKAALEAERYYKVQEEQVLIILGGKVTPELVLDTMKNTHLKAIVSEQFQTLEEFGERCESLKMIREIAFMNKGKTQIREKDWYVKARIYNVRKRMRDSEIQNIQIQKLIYEDEKKNGELFETLKKYLICANNLAETAKELHIHRNTLVYRLKQIDEILEYNINDVKDSRELLIYMMMAF